MTYSKKAPTGVAAPAGAQIDMEFASLRKEWYQNGDVLSMEARRPAGLRLVGKGGAHE